MITTGMRALNTRLIGIELPKWDRKGSCPRAAQPPLCGVLQQDYSNLTFYYISCVPADGISFLVFSSRFLLKASFLTFFSTSFFLYSVLESRYGFKQKSTFVGGIWRFFGSREESCSAFYCGRSCSSSRRCRK